MATEQNDLNRHDFIINPVVISQLTVRTAPYQTSIYNKPTVDLQNITPIAFDVQILTSIYHLVVIVGYW